MEAPALVSAGSERLDRARRQQADFSLWRHPHPLPAPDRRSNRNGVGRYHDRAGVSAAGAAHAGRATNVLRLEGGGNTFRYRSYQRPMGIASAGTRVAAVVSASVAHPPAAPSGHPCPPFASFRGGSAAADRFALELCLGHTNPDGFIVAGPPARPRWI